MAEEASWAQDPLIFQLESLLGPEGCHLQPTGLPQDLGTKQGPHHHKILTNSLAKGKHNGSRVVPSPQVHISTVGSAWASLHPVRACKPRRPSFPIPQLVVEVKIFFVSLSLHQVIAYMRPPDRDVNHNTLTRNG
jgi:hypothetical protein